MATMLVPGQLSGSQLDAVRELVAAASLRAGRDALSDQARSLLTSAEVEHALALDGDELTGYAQLDGDSLEIVGVAPEALDVFAARRVLVWTHGEHSSLAALLSARGFIAERQLLLMRRAAKAVDVRPIPAGVTIRAFVPGRDEQDWLRVNAAAFADHPEQGGWTLDDLQAREHEDWFDPAGFLLAWRGETLAGFHWTKVHPDGAGEVYVLGVDPAGQGGGLGATLLLAGLARLYELGCPSVLLYVDATNTAALRLYERQGFVRADLDEQWVSPVPAT